MDDRLAAYLDDLYTDGRRHDAPLADRLRRLRNMTPDAAGLIAQFVRAAGAGRVVEIGTSNGYSAIWFADAVRDTGGRLDSVETDLARAAEATKNIGGAGLSAYATVHHADGGRFLDGLPGGAVDLVVLDAERPAYPGYLPALRRVLTPRGVIAVDNAVSHAAEVAPFGELVAADPGFSVRLHEVGDGVLTAVRVPGHADGTGEGGTAVPGAF